MSQSAVVKVRAIEAGYCVDRYVNPGVEFDLPVQFVGPNGELPKWVAPAAEEEDPLV